MSGTDVGPLQNQDDPLLGEFQKIDVGHSWVEGAWKGTTDIPDDKYLTAGERYAKSVMSHDRFARDYALDHMTRNLGIQSDESLPPDAQEALSLYRSLRAKGAADDIRVRQLADDREVVPGSLRMAQAVGNGMLQLGQNFLVELPRFALNAMTPGGEGLGDKAVNALHSAIGLDGIGRPDPGLMLEALGRKVAGDTRPISSVYSDFAKAESGRLAGRSIIQTIGEGIGQFAGSTGPLFLGKLGKAMKAGEGTVAGLVEGLPAVQAAIGFGVKNAPKIMPKVLEAARLAMSPGLRIGTDIALKTEGDGSERAGAFLFGLATAPVATWISSWASRMATGVLKGAPQFNAAFADWLENSAAGAKVASPEAGLTQFIKEGMPGVPAALAVRGAAEAGRVLLEGFGFSGMDIGWWHDVIHAWNDPKAATRAAEKLVTNGLGLAILARGGSGRWYEAFESNAAREALLRARSERQARMEAAYAKQTAAESPAKNAERMIAESPTKPTETAPEPVSKPPAQEARPAEPATSPSEAPVAPAPVEGATTQEPAPAPLDDTAFAQSRIALHGIGNPVGDGERVVYDGDNPPLIVRWTPEEGFQRREALAETQDWKRMTKAEVARYRQGTEPRPIPEQVVVADRVATQLVTRSDIHPETVKLAHDAMRALASIPATEDPAISAALQLVEQVPPETWNPQQFDAFNQLVLRGTTPAGQQTVLQAFAAMGQEQPEAAPAAVHETPSPAEQGSTPQEAPATAAEATFTGTGGGQGETAGEGSAQEAQQAPVADVPSDIQAVLPAASRPWEGKLSAPAGFTRGSYVRDWLIPSARIPRRSDGGRDYKSARDAGISDASDTYWDTTLSSLGRSASSNEINPADYGLVRDTLRGIQTKLGEFLDEQQAELDLYGSGMKGMPGAAAELAKKFPNQSDWLGDFAKSASDPETRARWARERIEKIKKSLAKIGEIMAQLDKNEASEFGSAESGKVDVRLAGGALLAAAGLVPGGTTALQIAGAVVGARQLYKHWAQDTASRLQYQGDPVLAKIVYRGFQKVREKIGEFVGELEPLVQKVRELSDEKPVHLGGNRSAINAARWAQAVDWTDLGVGTKKTKRAYGVSNNLRFLDGWETDQSNLSQAQRDLLEAQHNVLVLAGQMANRVSLEMTDRTTGRVFPVKFDPAKWRAPRVSTQEFRDIKETSEEWKIIRDAVMDLNAVTLQQAEQSMRLMREETGFKRAAMEYARIIRKMPDYIRTDDGRDIQLFEYRPYEYAQRIQDSVARRLANVVVRGQESLGGKAHPNSPKGISLSPNATPEQIAVRQAEQDYVLGSKDPDKALRALVVAQRAHAGLPLEETDSKIQDLMPVPGSAWHDFVRNVLWPIRGIYTIAKLPQAAAANLMELHGNPASYFGSWRAMKANASVNWDAIFNRKELMADARRFSEMGLVAEMPTRRWGGFNTDYTHAHRGMDIVRQFSIFAAPNKWANWKNDIALARLVDGLVSDLRAGKVKGQELNEVGLTLRELDYSPAEIEQFLTGKATPEMERELHRRARADTMGVRGPERKGYLQGLRSWGFFVPFQSYMSNNQRVWGRIAKIGRELLAGEDDPLPGEPTLKEVLERVQKAPVNIRYQFLKRVLRHLRGKSLVSAATVLVYAGMAYGVNLLAAFKGIDDEQTVKNFLSKLGLLAVMQESAGPVLGPIVQDAIQGRDDRSFLDAVAQSTWVGSVVADVYRMLNGTGPYAGRAGKGITAIPARLMEFLIQQTPVFKYARQWFEDTELLAYVRRRYELFPPGVGSAKDMPAFQNAMKQFATKLQANSLELSVATKQELQDLLREAVAAGPGDSDKIKLAEWEQMTPAQKREAGWTRVVDSLQARRVLRGLDKAHLAELRRVIGDRGMKRLEQLDRSTERFIEWAKVRR